ncbi:hypothetical protein [Vibrio sp.]|uniref:hypothetical protein n=1 Tax=Vibrio sp. TaxID=678 RepID=UPI003D0B8C48
MKICLLALLFTTSVTAATSVDDLIGQAKQGDAEAQYHLGELYLSGDQVDRSPEEALYWLKQAARQGNRAATFTLADQLLNGKDIEHNSTQAMYWLTSLAVKDDTDAQLKLGQLLETRATSPSPTELAKIWYQLAADKSTHAEQAYARLLEQQFNQQRAKQVANITEQESTLLSNTSTLSALSDSESNSNTSLLAMTAGLVLALMTILTLYLRQRRISERLLKTADRDVTATQQQLNEQQRLIAQQKRQLELLYRQLKKRQSASQQPGKSAASGPDDPAQPVPAVTKQDLACAMLGYKPSDLPDKKQIKQRYKQLCKIYHPDVKGSDEEMKRLNAAVKLVLAQVRR